jgi:putative component of membrane protein insertase Oxa1/YidC/SpoIIIJ protein YidD
LQHLTHPERRESRVLPRAIALYRAHLSGRGPLARVRCTFERTESCSAYGLRVAREASLVRAASLVAKRIRHCGCLSVYRDRDRDAWLWHPVHEAKAAQEIDAELEVALELPATRAAVLRANALVGRELGDGARVAACRDLIGSIGETRASGTPPEQLLVRGAGAWFAKARRRRRTRVVAALTLTTLIVVASLALGAQAMAGACVLAGIALVARASWRCAREVARGEGLLASAAFRSPSRR